MLPPKPDIINQISNDKIGKTNLFDISGSGTDMILSNHELKLLTRNEVVGNAYLSEYLK